MTEEHDWRTVSLAGRFGEGQVPELLRACEGATALTLDLADLVSVDTAGVNALHRLRLRGAVIVGASGYIQMKLDSGVGPSDSPSRRRRFEG